MSFITKDISLFIILLLVKQGGIHRLHHIGIGPKSRSNIHLGIGLANFGGQGDQQITTSTAHALRAMDLMRTVGQGNAQQFSIPDMAVGLTVHVDANSAGGTIKRALPIQINAPFGRQIQRIAARGTRRCIGINIAHMTTGRTFYP